MRSPRRAGRPTAGLVAVLVVAAACSTAACSTAAIDGKPAADPAPTTASSTAPDPSTAPEPSTSPSTTPVPAGRAALTGFGATLATFRATHVLAPSVSSDEGCCYAPIVRVDAGVPIPTWNVANSPGDRVTFLVHNFARGTDEATATRRIEVQDLPADARVVHTKVSDGGCRFTVYRSATLARELSIRIFSVRLYSPTAATAAPQYVPTSIEQAKILTGDLDICVV